MNPPTTRTLLHAGLIALAIHTIGVAGEEQPTAVAYAPTADHTVRTVEGWKVHIDNRLLGEKAALGRRALDLIEHQLYAISRVVPGPALEKLHEVPIWLGVGDPHGRFPCACYHPSERWLRSHGYNPDKAEAVDILNAKNFLRWSRDQPSMLLHELAHAYHHRVLGYDHPELKAAYRHAADGDSYDLVLHISGGRQRHYALNNDQEYFAEATEAYFGVNDFYPFVRAELREHDPRMFELLAKLWGER